MEEKKSIYFQRPNQKKEKAKPSSSDPDSEEESFSDVFKIKKLSKSAESSSPVLGSQVNWKHLKSQLRKVDPGSSSEDKSNGSSEYSDITDEVYDKIVQCPLCLKKVQESSNAWKVNHLKQCAAKHKVTTQQLLKALKLQIKQFEEREALGLPNVRSERPTGSRRQTGNTLMKQMSSKDPSVQLAMALSASLQEAEEAALIEETSSLFQAGLETQAMECCKTLETLPVCHLKPPTSNKDKRSRATTVPVLLTRSQEERDRLISEKVETLVLLQEQFPLPDLPTEPYRLKSRTLKKIAIPNAQWWELSQNENSEDSLHYTTTYLKCASPEKIASCRGSVKSVASIEKQYSQVEQNNLQELETLFDSRKMKNNNVHYNKTSSMSTIASSSTSLKSKENVTKKGGTEITPLTEHERTQMYELRILSKNLGAMVGEQTLSDITIFTKEETAIPSHKIILLSRIPSMLKEVIKEVSGGKTNEMLMWNMEKKLCLIVLKYVYGGVINRDAIKKLDDSQLNELKQFCDTYRIRVLSRMIENVEAGRSVEGKSERVDDLTSEQHTEDSNRSNSLAKWLDKLKNRDPTVWKSNFRQRFNKIDHKLKLNSSEKTSPDANSNGVVKKHTDSRDTDVESIETKSTKLKRQDEQSDDEKMNETISVISKSDDSSSVVSSVCNDKKRNLNIVDDKDPTAPSTKDKLKKDIYYYDSDIYDQETYVSVKSSDTEQVSNSDAEVRQSLKSMSSIYDKNTLCNSLGDDNTQSKEQVCTPPKGKITSSQQTLNASPELFSESDEDNDKNVLNVQSSKTNTQMNLHRLINMMEVDINSSPIDQSADDGKKRKRSPSRRPLDNLKRSKQISSEHGSSPRSPCLKTKVNRTNTHSPKETHTSKHTIAENDFTSNLSTKTNLSVPCVAGYSMKSRIARRNLAIDFDRIEVDTSAPHHAPISLNLTVENLMLFNEINDKCNDDSVFQRVNLPINNHVASPDRSSHGSSLLFDTYMNKYKDIPKIKTIPTIVEETSKKPNYSGLFGSTRKKCPTPDFLKTKFDQNNLIEIKSSSEDNTECYPTRALSRLYQLSQKIKKRTPPKRKTSCSQPQKKTVTPKSKRAQSHRRFQSQTLKQNVQLFPSDSSDELSSIIKQKSKQTQDLTFEILSPIPRVNTSHVSYGRTESETQRKIDGRCSSLNNNKAKDQDSTSGVKSPSPSKFSFSPVKRVKSHRKQMETTDQHRASSESKSSDSEASDLSVVSASMRTKPKYSNRPLQQKKKLSKIKKSAKISSRQSTTSIWSSSEETDVVKKKHVDKLNNLRPVDGCARYQEDSAIDINFPGKDMSVSEATNQGSRKEDENRVPVPKSPINESDPSPPLFSPPRYIWDDPDYHENILPPIEDPILSKYPSDNFDHSPESFRTNNEDKLVSHGKTIVGKTIVDNSCSSENEPEGSLSSFLQKLSSYSQTLQNSLFMRKYEEYFGSKSKDEQKNQVEVCTKESFEVENTTIPGESTSSSIKVAPSLPSLPSMPLSPNVIINEPEIISDSSSNVALRKEMSKHEKHFRNSSNNIDYVDVDHTNENIQRISRTQKSKSTLQGTLKSLSTSRTYAEQSQFGNNSTNTTLCKTKETKKYADISSSDGESSGSSLTAKRCKKRSISRSKSTALSSNMLTDSDHTDHGSATPSDSHNVTQPLTAGNKVKDINEIDEIKANKRVFKTISSHQTNVYSIDKFNTYPTSSPKFKLNFQKSSYIHDNNLDKPTKSHKNDSKYGHSRNRIGQKSMTYGGISSDTENESNSSRNSSEELFSKSKFTTEQTSSSVPDSSISQRDREECSRKSTAKPVSSQSKIRDSEKISSSSDLNRSNISTTASELSRASPKCSPSYSHSQPSTSHMQQSPSSRYMQQSQPSTSHMQQSPSSRYMQQSQPSTRFANACSSDKEIGSNKRVRKSLNFDHLLEESLHLNESYVNRLEANHERGAASTPAATKTRQSLNDTSIVTPLADYSTMETPLLKKELTKYGLKPSLGKGKAKLLLRYIYNQTHPYVESEPENPPPKRRRKDEELIENPRSDATRPEEVVNRPPEEDDRVRISQAGTENRFEAFRGDECDSSGEESTSEVSIGSQEALQQVYEESILFEQNLECPQDDNTQVTPLFFSEVDKILRSAENYRKILSYEPLWLEHLHKELKQRGVRSNLKQLMDYLDEKCITFRTTRKRPCVKPGAKSKGRKAVHSQEPGMQPARPVRRLRHQSQPVTSRPTVTTRRGARRN